MRFFVVGDNLFESGMLCLNCIMDVVLVNDEWQEVVVGIDG